MSFSENLKTELYYSSIKASELARATKIPYATILSYLNKDVLPRVDYAVRIAKFLNVSVEYLVTGKEQNKVYTNRYPTVKELKELPKNIIFPLTELIHEISILN